MNGTLLHQVTVANTNVTTSPGLSSIGLSNTPVRISVLGYPVKSGWDNPLTIERFNPVDDLEALA